MTFELPKNFFKKIKKEYLLTQSFDDQYDQHYIGVHSLCKPCNQLI